MEDHITNEDQDTKEELITDEDQIQLRQELEECKQKLQSQLQETKVLQARPTTTKEQLQENKDMVTYTGLPNFETLTLVFDLAQKVMPIIQKSMEIEN